MVELLVVIVIIAVLAAVAFGIAAKLKKRGDSAKSVQNMRQIGPLMMGYAMENSSRLPPPRADVPDGNGGFTQLHWHQALLAQVYSETDPEEFWKDDWWESNKPFLRNPLASATTKPYAFAAWNPGFAMNREIAWNLGKDSGNWSAGKNGPQSYGIPLSSVPDQARTPIVVPRGDWHYTSADLKSKDINGFLVDGKIGVLFVDGHIETMKPQEYITRNLGNVPPKK